MAMCAPSGAAAVVALFAMLLAIGACGGGAWRGTALDPATVSFAPELGVELADYEQTPSGLYVLDLEEGEGATARRSSLVYVHYAGWLPDGTLVDTSVGGDPFQFRLGEGEVIRAWNEGIPGMRIGGRRRLVVRPGLGYGSLGSTRVPPDATLLFEMELVDVR